MCQAAKTPEWDLKASSRMEPCLRSLAIYIKQDFTVYSHGDPIIDGIRMYFQDKYRREIEQQSG